MYLLKTISFIFIFTFSYSNSIEWKMFESLVGMDKKTLLYTDPNLATDVAKVSDDHLVYEYNIRKDAYFSDGVPLDANNFIFYLKCIKNGKKFKGRKCARKISKKFRLMEADLYNLQPTIGELLKIMMLP